MEGHVHQWTRRRDGSWCVCGETRYGVFVEPSGEARALAKRERIMARNLRLAAAGGIGRKA